MSSRPTSVEAAQGLVHIAEGHLLLRLTLIDLFEALDHSRIEIGLRRLRRFKVGKRVIERDWLIIKLLPDDIADERVFKGMTGVFPFHCLGACRTGACVRPSTLFQTSPNSLSTRCVNQ